MEIDELIPFIEAGFTNGSIGIGGILIHGPSGVGKTRLVTRIASSLAATVTTHFTNFTSLFGKSFGGAEDSIMSLFEDLEKMAPSLCLCEDIESLCLSNSVGDITLSRTRALFYRLLDEFHSRDVRVVFIYSCRNPQSLDRALFAPYRVDLVMEISPPSLSERMIILKGMTQQLRITEQDKLIEYVARKTHGYLGSDLEKLCRQAVLETIRRCEGSAGVLTECVDFDRALATSQHPSSTEIDLSNNSAINNSSIEDLGGMSSKFERLRLAVIEPLVAFADSRPLPDEEILQALRVGTPKGVVIHGPSGCGKTTLAMALASQLKDHARFINIPCTSLVHAEVGSSEKQLSRAFQAARKAAPALVLLDQIDVIALKRGSNGDSSAASTMDRILSLLLVELDGALQSADGLVVIATTHDLSLLEPALLRPGRLDQHIALSLPDIQDREEILERLTKDIPLSLESLKIETVEAVTSPLTAQDHVALLEMKRRAALFKQLAVLTEGWSGADLSHLCQEAAIICMRENMHAVGVSSDHFLKALRVRTR